MKAFSAFASFISLVVCGASAALAVPKYSIAPLGLIDLEHTRNDGFLQSEAIGMNEAGQVGGYSFRFEGGSTDAGRTAWFYDGTNTIDISLGGSEHTRNDGYKLSVAEELSETGHVSGVSLRYSGGTELGRSVWLYDGASTHNIGLTNIEHTRNDGYRYGELHTANHMNDAGQVMGHSERYNGGSTYLGRSAWFYNGIDTVEINPADTQFKEHSRNDGFMSGYPFLLNEAGQVLGNSQRFNGTSANRGQTAWLYNGLNTITLGLTGAGYTRNDGYRHSYASKLNEGGLILGWSDRFGGNSDLGQTAWLYDGMSTIPLGLTDFEHTRSDGYRYSVAELMNDAGQVSGRSYRYLGAGDFRGESAWLYDGANTIRIGLTGSEHTRNDNHQRTFLNQMNAAGQVVGYSYRYSGSADMGFSAWLYDGTTTIDIGLTDPEHTRADGFRDSHPHNLDAMNEAGQVIGESKRYDGMNLAGFSAWLYDGTTTIDIGPTGSEFTRSDGHQDSDANKINEAGQVSGWSVHYSGTTHMGTDAWIYDPALDQNFVLRLSQRSDGYSHSGIHYFGEDGLALGLYYLYDDLDNLLGNRAFYFTIADGMHDLGLQIDGGLAASDWESLAVALQTNADGQILGDGKYDPPTGSALAYLLTPEIIRPGDYNRDTFVNDLDYQLWKETFGSLVDLAADGNDDGVVNAADYAVWRDNCVPIADIVSEAIVPEPNTAALAAFAVAGLLALKQRAVRRSFVLSGT